MRLIDLHVLAFVEAWWFDGRHTIDPGGGRAYDYLSRREIAAGLGASDGQIASALRRLRTADMVQHNFSSLGPTGYATTYHGRQVMRCAGFAAGWLDRPAWESAQIDMQRGSA